MNINEILTTSSAAVMFVTTAIYLWKTRVIGADKELLAKYKNDYAEMKEKYNNMKREAASLDTQLEMANVRLAKANATIAAYEGQPYRAPSQSLEVANESN